MNRAHSFSLLPPSQTPFPLHLLFRFCFIMMRAWTAQMAKIKTVFSCQGCGYQSAKWLGKCPDCGEWNTLVEERLQPAGREGEGGRGGAPGVNEGGLWEIG